jgi:AcrR family transcriptional regulator
MATTASSTLRAGPTPLFRRAKPQDAVDLAVATFVGGDRVDLRALATQLAVSRATLHRWFGSREQLLDRVCEQLAVRFTSDAAAAAPGGGDERVCAFCRGLMETAVEYEPVRSFVVREPELALRLILGEDGAVHRVVAHALRSVIAETRPPARVKPLEDRIDVIVQVATALVWATFMVGDAPQIDSAVEIVRMILAAG